jgi:hypothetical protein
MTRTYHQRFALLLAAGLTTLLAALALAATSASASEFCGGQTISSIQTCFGASRTFQIVRGRGTTTGVCVGYNEIGRGGCSAGAAFVAEWNIGSAAFRTPRIMGNSSNNTTVQWADAS